MDYRITDSITDPPGEPVTHSETLIRLNGCFCCYAPPSSAPGVGPLPADSAGVVTFGSTHTLSRLNKQVLGLWSSVLAAVPGSRLLIFRTTLRGDAAKRILELFKSNGIEPERILLQSAVPEQGHLAAYNNMDVMLDTLPWSGHASASEALWMGVPVVTLSGNRFAGRMVTSVLSALGLNECIARSPEEFVGKASALAASGMRLRELRNGLREKMSSSPLCDGARFTAGLEAAYLRMWNETVPADR